MRSNPRIATFLAKLEAAGVGYRINWQARRDGRRASDVNRPDVHHLSFIGDGFRPGERTAIIIDYGNDDGYCLYVETKRNDIDADVARIARPRDADVAGLLAVLQAYERALIMTDEGVVKPSSLNDLTEAHNLGKAAIAKAAGSIDAKHVNKTLPLPAYLAANSVLQMLVNAAKDCLGSDDVAAPFIAAAEQELADRGAVPPKAPATNRPGDAAWVYAQEHGVDYETALVRCNMD